LSSFSDPEIIASLKGKFIPATDNDWYNRRRKDAAGEFFRSVADQGPRKGDGTRQGHYILTASGKLLGFNNNRATDRRKAFIADALAKWEALPEAEKKPGAIDVKPLVPSKSDPKFHASPPQGGVVLVASERILKKDAAGKWARCTADDDANGWGHLAAVDRMWIQKNEWTELLATGKTGGPVAAALAHRLLRYHLIDFTRGEPPFWKREEIRTLKLKISPLGKPGHYKLQGVALLATAADPAKAERGFEVALLGKIETDKTGKPTRFDLVGLGEHWGEGTYTKGARPGRSPLGIALSLADPKKAADLIRPQGSHWLKGYWEADKH
jgi:hypothetical protein